MCGIFGSVSGGSARLDRELFVRCVRTLAHRGPDDEGVWFSSSANVGLGHRRLAIIDLSPGGHQPMHSADGSLVVVFNGEIYNYRALREELAAAGSKFATTSDTEVLLEAYRVWGMSCLDRLNGMFAFALYDVRNRRLVAARDRAGEKPLFYRHTGNTLTFGSELKALLANPEFPREIDPEALNAYLAYGYVPGAACVLRGYHKLPPGHALQLDMDRNDLRIWPYWALPTPSSERAPTTDEAVDEVARLLSDSVGLCLVSDVPVGVLLSGGVDSSLVTAMAAQRVDRVRTFTVTFPGHKQFDESAYAKMVADHFGTLHTELPAEEAGPDVLSLLARQFDEPIADHSIIPTFLVSRLIRSHATVALGGDGGDELFGGYPHYSLALRSAKLAQRTPGAVRRAVASMAHRLPMGSRGRNHLIGFGEHARGGLTHVNLFFDKLSRSRLVPHLYGGAAWLGAPERERAARESDALSPLQNATRLDFQTTLADDYLVKVDRASMLSGLEVRAPFLDFRLIDYAFCRLTDEQKVQGNHRKILLRALAGRLLPGGLDLRRKQGFSVPLAEWLRGPWGSFAKDVLLSRRTTLFAQTPVEQLFRLQSRGYHNANRIFALLMFELWRTEYGATLPSEGGA